MINSPEDIAGVRAASQLARALLDHLCAAVKEGVSTLELDEMARDFTEAAGAQSGPLGYTANGHSPFKGHTCLSVNEIVCHGIPRASQILRRGDVINIDVTPVLNGYYGDTSRTVTVGEPDPDSAALIAATEAALAAGIALCKPGEYLGTIGHAINASAQAAGFSIIREFCGHGIGKVFHTQPFVPHYGVPRTGLKLVPHMIFTIEPILCLGDPAIMFVNDWESVTRSGAKTAQAEHTVLITDTGHEILTA